MNRYIVEITYKENKPNRVFSCDNEWVDGGKMFIFRDVKPVDWDENQNLIIKVHMKPSIIFVNMDSVISIEISDE